MSADSSQFLWVPGLPQVKQRPRMTRRGRTYTPQATHLAELGVAQAAHEWGIHPVDGPVEVEAEFYKEGTAIWITSLDEPNSGPLRGDVDNYVKLVLDGLQKDEHGRNARNGGAPVITDDRAVVRLVADKRAGEPPTW